MKKLILLSAIIYVSKTNAQNPFESIGKTTKPMLSLSNGKYVEHFENDSVRQIGSVMVNMNTEQIIAFVDRKEQAKKVHSQTSSRFLSIDPLARQFPFLTPYQYAGNKPISSIDLDGLEDLDYRVMKKLENGNALVKVWVEEGSTANSHNGSTKVHNYNTGESKDQFKYNELNTIINKGYVVDKGDRNASGPPSKNGSSNYYFSVNTDAFENNLSKIKNGNQLDENGNVKFQSGVFEVKPITPTGNESSQFNITNGVAGIQNGLIQSVEKIVSTQIKESSNQDASNITKINFQYDKKFQEVFTDEFKQNIQSSYPNAQIEFNQNADDGMARDINNTSIITSVEGTPYHEE